jgi:hypothetical protein
MRKPTLQKRKIPQTTVQFHHETLVFPDVSSTPLYLASPWTRKRCARVGGGNG